MVLSYFRSPASVQYFTCKGHVGLQRLQRYFRKYGSTKVLPYIHVHSTCTRTFGSTFVQLRVRVRVRVQYIVVLTVERAEKNKKNALRARTSSKIAFRPTLNFSAQCTRVVRGSIGRTSKRQISAFFRMV
jgi:hypothetical protein